MSHKQSMINRQVSCAFRVFHFECVDHKLTYQIDHKVCLATAPVKLSWSFHNMHRQLQVCWNVNLYCLVADNTSMLIEIGIHYLHSVLIAAPLTRLRSIFHFNRSRNPIIIVNKCDIVESRRYSLALACAYLYHHCLGLWWFRWFRWINNLAWSGLVLDWIRSQESRRSRDKTNYCCLWAGSGQLVSTPASLPCASTLWT